MNSFIHSILGTAYLIKFGDRETLKMSEENQGECRVFKKEIAVCTDMGDCESWEELCVKVQETIAHEILHAYINECGLDLECDAEERVACFYMKNYKKMQKSIEEIIEKSGYLTK